MATQDISRDSNEDASLIHVKASAMYAAQLERVGIGQRVAAKLQQIEREQYVVPPRRDAPRLR